MKLDEALILLGAHGRYQVLVYLAISVFDNLLGIWHMQVMAFLGYEPNHHCKLAEGADYNRSIPHRYRGDELIVDKCHMYEYYGNDSYSNHTVPCEHGWHYDRRPVHSSVVSEWDLVCSRNVLPETSNMVFNFGVMFGALVFGFFSDKFGRKSSFLFACVVQAVVGTITAFSTDFYMFMILRFFVGALQQGVNITGFIMATELFPPKQRTIYSVTHEFFWAIGGALIPVFAWFLRDWRPLQIAVSAPGILALALWWLIPESVVWLVCQGRVKEAEVILEKAAKFNKKNLPVNCLGSTYGDDASESKPMLENGGHGTIEMADIMGNDEHHVTTPTSATSHVSVSKRRTYTILDLFRTPHMRKITFCIAGLWALNTMVYYGLSYNTPNLYGDMYLNFLIGQLVEIPSVAVTMFLMYKIGRRWPLCLFHIFGGLVCMASPFIPKQTASGVDLTWVSVSLAMLGKFAINSSFTVIYVYGPEIYPTVVRNTGAGFASLSGRFGGILFPYINYLSKLNTPLAKQLPLLVFGILSVVGGLLALPLPETRDKPLAETIEDIENYDEFCRKAMSLDGQVPPQKTQKKKKGDTKV